MKEFWIKAKLPEYPPVESDDLCRWDSISEILKGSQKAKALKFNRDGLYEWDKEHQVWLCKPIKGYNSTTYKIAKINGEFQCNCQWNVKEGLICSHIIGLYLWLKNRRWEDGHAQGTN